MCVYVCESVCVCVRVRVRVCVCVCAKCFWEWRPGPKTSGRGGGGPKQEKSEGRVEAGRELAGKEECCRGWRSGTLAK